MSEWPKKRRVNFFAGILLILLALDHLVIGWGKPVFIREFYGYCFIVVGAMNLIVSKYSKRPW
jgi:hypothetical protein